ncbi:MAG: GTPase HflX [Oscillospiraceae bacterium]|jgi:GTP-binding protein HflX|nr:GTPase HflX [Oscillospiraceae bacterium]
MQDITEKKIEKAVLAGLNADIFPAGENSTDETMDELEALLETAGGISVGRVLQNRASPDPRTFLGEGKVSEMRALMEAEGAALAVFDNELSPSQTRALEDDLGARVLDRSSLILDIFATRARTREGRLQVELAQYKYMLPRLTRMWTHLERQAGTSAPIGTRGPGETQLETDRRHIRRKISKLEEELSELRRARATERRQRVKNSIPVLALVGYTNAGKSTILNLLSGAGIDARDRLFDTLDTTTRRIKISDSASALLSDTVGFIRKLPHHLVDAFRATLEELKYADMILHVIDASSPAWPEQARVTDALIEKLGAGQTPRIEIYNKCDKPGPIPRPHGENISELSAVTGQGRDELLAMIERMLGLSGRIVRLLIPYSDSAVVDALHKLGVVQSADYAEAGTLLTAKLDTPLTAQYKKYIEKSGEMNDERA